MSNKVSDNNNLEKYDDAIGCIVEKWQDHKDVSMLAKQMEILGKNMAKLRGASDAENKKKARVVWQKAAGHYWDLLWALVEAKIDAGPPEDLEFDTAERLFIDFGHLSSDYTTANAAFADQLSAPSALDMYQYNRMTDYIKESYALIFGKTYKGPLGGATLQEKRKRFEGELKMVETRRRMAVNTLLSTFPLIDKQELDTMLKNMEKGLMDATELDIRTKRVREAEGSSRALINENSKIYNAAEKNFLNLMEDIERKVSKQDEQPEETQEAHVSASGESQPARVADEFDPFVEIRDDITPVKPEAAPVETVSDKNVQEELSEYEGSAEDSVEHTAINETVDKADKLDPSLKIINNITSLHDKSKFLASLIVHVSNEAERWNTRCANAKVKYKGQGIPALKLELREGLNKKKDFMMLAAHSARVDSSPLCQNRHMPISTQRAGEIMMDLTPLDPDMLRVPRIRMYGIPRIMLVPGQGLGVYDWDDNSFIIPIFPAVSDVKDFGFALALFRWDNDEDRTLKDTYALLKVNKGKGIRALQETFCNDYFTWISKERKGYRILPKEIANWFKSIFKQKQGDSGGSRR